MKKKDRTNLGKIVVLLFFGVLVFNYFHPLTMAPLESGTSVEICLTNSNTGNPICGGRVCLSNDFTDYYKCKNTESDGCTQRFYPDVSQGGTTRVVIVGNYRGLTNSQEAHSEFFQTGGNFYKKTYTISSQTDSSTECSVSPTTTLLTCSDSDNGKDIFTKGFTAGLTINQQSIGVYDKCLPNIWEPLLGGIVSFDPYIGEYFCNSEGLVDAVHLTCPSGSTCQEGACVWFGFPTTTTTYHPTTTTYYHPPTTTTYHPTTTTYYHPSTTTTYYHPTTTTTYHPAECYVSSSGVSFGCEEGEVCEDGVCVPAECMVFGIHCVYLVVIGLFGFVLFGFIYTQKKNKGRRR